MCNIFKCTCPSQVPNFLSAFLLSRNRKLAVPTIRDAGASREQQSLLTRHMAHTVETADKHYDRSKQTASRIVGTASFLFRLADILPLCTLIHEQFPLVTDGLTHGLKLKKSCNINTHFFLWCFYAVINLKIVNFYKLWSIYMLGLSKSLTRMNHTCSWQSRDVPLHTLSICPIFCI
jgi:hypothetical protein